MTNLQQGAPILSAQGLRRLWFAAPAAGLGVVSLVMAAAFLVPMWQTLQRDTTRLRQLEDLQMQVSLMRQQLRAQDIQQEKALLQRDKLLRMIAGSGDVSTLLAVLDREARASGVQLDLYEPQTAGEPTPAPGAPPAGRNQAQPQAAQPAANPLETAGLQAQGMLISLRGPYPNLLTFLQRLESLNLLVIQSDLKLEAPPPSTDPGKPPPQDVSMKLSLRVYGKPGNGESEASAAAPGTSAPATQPAAPGAAASGAANPASTTPPARPGNPTAPTASSPASTPAQPSQAGANTAPPQGSNPPAAASAPAGSRPAGR
jgi:type IV pilus assembly protein PilO